MGFYGDLLEFKWDFMGSEWDFFFRQKPERLGTY